MTLASMFVKVLIGLAMGFAGTRILARHGFDVRDPDPFAQVRAWLAVAIFAGVGGFVVELADAWSR